MIVGVGNDIVDMRRMERVAARFPERLLDHILTERERAELPATQQLNFLAGRWAAKEALGKALGIGVHGPLSWQHVSVSRDNEGKPYFVFSEETESFLLGRGVMRCHLSISHDGDYTWAIVIAEGEAK